MDLEKVWNSVLSELELTLTRAVFRTMFVRTRLLSVEKGVATIGCPNPYLVTMMEQRYYSLLKSILDRLTESNLSLVFAIFENAEKVNEKDMGPLFEEGEAKLETQDPGKNIESNFLSALKKAHLRADLTFESYAVSSSNQMAYAAADAVSKNLGTSYNPLFLWGGVGVGKTHLMQAIGNDVIKKRRGAKVIFCMGEEFTNEIVDAIQGKSTRVFKEKYRTVDLLLLDDVQFLAGKNTAQEEFFHTFNTILREGGQVVLTSDRQPSEISRLEDRLRSRFEAGLIVDVANPDFELRTAILRIKAKQRGIDLPMDAAQVVASEVENPRGLEGVLIKLLSYSQTRGHAINLELVKEVLGKKDAEIVKKTILPNEAVRVVSEYFNVKVPMLISDRRDRPISNPRQILMYVLRVDLGLTLMQVADLLGGRDHTTIMHGVKKVRGLLDSDEKTKGDLGAIKKKLYG